jgi:hypothetical protein
MAGILSLFESGERIIGRLGSEHLSRLRRSKRPKNRAERLNALNGLNEL